jgi:hypothetical protein
MTIIEILQNIFGKKRKAAPIKPRVIFTLPNKPIEQDLPPKINPVTGEVINELAGIQQIDYSVIEFDKQMKLLNDLGAEIIRLQFAQRLKSNGIFGYTPLEQIAINNAELLKKLEAAKIADKADVDALLYKAKSYAKLAKDAYNSEDIFDVKVKMKASYDILKKWYNDSFDNVFLNSAFYLEAPTAPVNGTGGGRPVVVITNPQTGGSQTVGGSLPTPTTPTGPVNNTQYPTWSDYSNQPVFYPNTIVWANGNLYKALTVINRSVQPLPTDGRWLKL